MFCGSRISHCSNQNPSQVVVPQLPERGSGIEMDLARAQEKLELMYARKRRELEQAEGEWVSFGQGARGDELLQRITLIKSALNKLDYLLLDSCSDPEDRIRQIKSLLREIPAPSILKRFESQPKAELLNLDSLEEEISFELDDRAILILGTEEYDVRVHKNTQDNVAVTHPSNFEEESKCASHKKNVAFTNKHTYSICNGSSEESIASLSLTADALGMEITSCKTDIKQKKEVLQEILKELCEIENALTELQRKKEGMTKAYEEKRGQLEKAQLFFSIMKEVCENIECESEMPQTIDVLKRQREIKKRDISQIRRECEDLETLIMDQKESPLQEKLEEKRDELIRLNDEWKVLVEILSKFEKGQTNSAILTVCQSLLKKADKRVQESRDGMNRMKESAHQVEEREASLLQKQEKLQLAYRRIQGNIDLLIRPKLNSLRKQRDELLECNQIDSAASLEEDPALRDKDRTFELDRKIELYKERLKDAKEVHFHRLEALEELKKIDADMAADIENSDWNLNSTELGTPESLKQDEEYLEALDKLKERLRNLRMYKNRSEAMIKWVASLVDMQRGVVLRAEEKVEALQRQIFSLAQQGSEKTLH